MNPTESLNAISVELERWFDSASGIARDWIDFKNEAGNILHIIRQHQGYPSLIEKLKAYCHVNHNPMAFAIRFEDAEHIIHQHQAALPISPEATEKTRRAIGEKLAYHTNQDSAEEWLKEADEILEIVRSIMGEPGGSGDTRMEAFNSPSPANQPREISDTAAIEAILKTTLVVGYNENDSPCIMESTLRHAALLIAQRIPEPVSVSLATLAQIAFESSGTAGMWVLVSDGMKDKYLLMTKAILDAAGVKYVD